MECEWLWLFLLYPNRALHTIAWYCIYWLRPSCSCSPYVLWMCHMVPTPSIWVPEWENRWSPDKLSWVQPIPAEPRPTCCWATVLSKVSKREMCCQPLREHHLLPLQNWLIQGKSSRRRTYVSQDCSNEIIFSQRDLCMCYICVGECAVHPNTKQLK